MPRPRDLGPAAQARDAGAATREQVEAALGWSVPLELGPDDSLSPLGLPDTELLQLATGLRGLVKRELLDPADAPRLRASAASRGLFARSWPDERQVEIVHLARDPATLDEAARLEPLERGERGPARTEAMRRLGELLGYPPCCVERFLAAEYQSDVNLLATLDGAVLPAASCFALAHRGPVQHYPCAPNCAPTRALGLATAAATAGGSALLAAATGEWIAFDGLRFLLRSRTRVLSAADAVEPTALRDPVVAWLHRYARPALARGLQLRRQASGARRLFRITFAPEVG